MVFSINFMALAVSSATPPRAVLIQTIQRPMKFRQQPGERQGARRRAAEQHDIEAGQCPLAEGEPRDLAEAPPRAIANH